MLEIWVQHKTTMKQENNYIQACYGTVADMPKPNYYAKLKRGDETVNHGPLTSTEWARLVEQEAAQGWQLVN